MKLVLKVKDRVLEHYSFQKPEVILGRDAAADIPIDNPVVSRHHARMRTQGDNVTIEDLGSANGTYVNGAAVTAPTRLKDGDRIEIGKFVIQVSLPRQVEEFNVQMEGTMQFDGADIQRRLREHQDHPPQAPAAPAAAPHTPAPSAPAAAPHAPYTPPPAAGPGWGVVATAAVLGFAAGFLAAAVAFRR